MGDILELGKINVAIRWFNNVKDLPMLTSICDNDLDWGAEDFKDFVKKKE